MPSSSSPYFRCDAVGFGLNVLCLFLGLIAAVMFLNRQRNGRRSSSLSTVQSATSRKLKYSATGTPVTPDSSSDDDGDIPMIQRVPLTEKQARAQPYLRAMKQLSVYPTTPIPVILQL